MSVKKNIQKEVKKSFINKNYSEILLFWCRFQLLNLHQLPNVNNYI